jgi:two-component system, chemotaxis family, chemotaxis protein CheY
VRALVVEDDPALRVLLEKLLASVAECDAVDDGVLALEAVERAFDAGQPYGLVCLDIAMPRMDGWEALERIRALEEARGIEGDARTVIIVMTARDSSQNLRQVLKGSPRQGFLLKPFRRRELFDQLRAFGLV